MNINIHLESMRDAERLSYLCNLFPYELSLHAKQFSADPKSTLGVLAMMYSDKANLFIETGDMPDDVIDEFSQKLSEFIKPTPVNP